MSEITTNGSIATNGYVYCFSNEHMPGIYKVGFTDRTPDKRLSEANTDTWSMPVWKMEFAMKINNPEKKEKIIHKYLGDKRITQRREFFKVDLDKIRDLFELMDGEWYVGCLKESPRDASTTPPRSPSPTLIQAPTPPIAPTSKPINVIIPAPASAPKKNLYYFNKSDPSVNTNIKEYLSYVANKSKDVGLLNSDTLEFIIGYLKAAPMGFNGLDDLTQYIKQNIVKPNQTKIDELSPKSFKSNTEHFYNQYLPKMLYEYNIFVRN